LLNIAVRVIVGKCYTEVNYYMVTGTEWCVWSNETHNTRIIRQNNIKHIVTTINSWKIDRLPIA